MEYIVIAALVVPLVIGLLLGMLRGSRRATLRLLLVILCLVAAFLLKDVLAEQLINEQIDGQTIEEIIMSMLPDEMQSLGETVVMPIVYMVAVALVFLVLFMFIKFLTWLIIFPILKIFVKKARKKKDGRYGNKHALIGGVIGLVQGAAVGLVLCITLNGLFFNFSNMMAAVNDLNDEMGNSPNAIVMVADAEGASGGLGGGEINPDELMAQLAAYKDCGICQTIESTGGSKLFDLVACMKTEDGTKLTLTGQMNALSGLLKMAKELSALQNMDMVGGLTGDIATDISTIFNKLDDIFAEMGDESKEVINTIAQTVAGELLPDDFGFDLAAIDFKTVSFRNEGEVITELNTYKDKPIEELTEDDAEKIVEIVMRSDIILPLLSSNDEFTIGLNEEQQAYAEREIEKLAGKPEADQKKIDMLKQFFGLNDRVNNNGNNDDLD